MLNGLPKIARDGLSKSNRPPVRWHERWNSSSQLQLLESQTSLTKRKEKKRVTPEGSNPVDWKWSVWEFIFRRILSDEKMNCSYLNSAQLLKNVSCCFSNLLLIWGISCNSSNHAVVKMYSRGAGSGWRGRR